jgi:hypothetical protein
MTENITERYAQAIRDKADGLITEQEFMLIEAEFKEWSEDKGQLLNG